MPSAPPSSELVCHVCCDTGQIITYQFPCNCVSTMHANCADQWWRTSQFQCPICRTPFTDDEHQVRFNFVHWTPSPLAILEPVPSQQVIHAIHITAVNPEVVEDSSRNHTYILCIVVFALMILLLLFIR